MYEVICRVARMAEELRLIKILKMHLTLLLGKFRSGTLFVFHILSHLDINSERVWLMDWIWDLFVYNNTIVKFNLESMKIYFYLWICLITKTCDSIKKKNFSWETNNCLIDIFLRLKLLYMYIILKHRAPSIFAYA